MSKPKFKYHINHHISLLPRAMSIGMLQSILKKDHGIARVTFYRDRNMLIDDPSSIPSDRLDIYAALFGVRPEEPKNYTLNVKPLSERKLTDVDYSLLKKSRLKKKSL
jgi:hypothetical protein